VTPAAQKRLLTPAEAAEYLGVQPQTLAAWRSSGRHGLPYVRVGSAIRYRLADLEGWLSRRTVTPKDSAEGRNAHQR
jgi:excisionase family DNA binding protein